PICTVRVRIDGGVLLPAAAEVLEVELIQLAQQQAEAETHRRAALAVLGLLIGQPLPDETVLALPDPAAPSEDAHRPEYAAFDRAKTTLDRQAALAASARRPRVSVFAEAAAGRPAGLDFFENRLTPFYTAGLRVAWQPWDWRTSAREREMLGLRRAMIEARADAFTLDVAAAAEQQRREVERLEALLASDDALLERRRRITAEAAVRFENGALTATDFLLERNAEHRARLARDLHRVQLAQARARYQTLLGDDR
ncbi:MAG: TolC family protein, partial [Rhodothermales bacterium]|nr:TolC family protein [Rhodothermales bacterium]